MLPSLSHAPGSYSEAAAANHTLCPPGTYTTESGQSACQDCPSGYYCPGLGTQIYLDCPAGRYCPLGTDSPQLCPIGTASSAINLSNSTQCALCPPGMLVVCYYYFMLNGNTLYITRHSYWNVTMKGDGELEKTHGNEMGQQQYLISSRSILWHSRNGNARWRLPSWILL